MTDNETAVLVEGRKLSEMLKQTTEQRFVLIMCIVEDNHLDSTMVFSNIPRSHATEAVAISATSLIAGNDVNISEATNATKYN